MALDANAWYLCHAAPHSTRPPIILPLDDASSKRLVCYAAPHSIHLPIILFLDVDR